ncbi:MAG: DUF3466 family protein [Succinivibrionaceae bacterium]|nr:DUF3466 family protein [Succinivibrionaceae bacterium]
MNRIFKTTLTAGSAAVLSAGLQAADAPFYTLEEISGNTKEYGYRLADSSSDYLTIRQKYDWWSFFDSVPTEIDLGDRYTYTIGCYYDSKVCDAYYNEDNENDGRGHSFYKAIHENAAYTYSLLNGGGRSSNLQGFRRNLSSDGTIIAGWIDNSERSFETGARFPVVWINGEKLQLGDQGFGMASEAVRTDDGAIIVGGAATETLIASNDRYHYCYEDYRYSNYDGNLRHCPGYHNKASLWAIDQDNSVTDQVYLAHYGSAGDKELSTADIRKIVRINDIYYAFGNSATDDIGWDTSSIATYWTFGLEDGKFVDVSNWTLPSGIDRPGKGDEHYGSTWFVDANDNGLAVGNARYTDLKNRAYPIEMFIYDPVEDKTYTPIRDKPFYGATNRAVAINSHNLIVGISDNRDSQESVANGNPRQTDGYLYNYNTDRLYSLNDLICTDSTCEINGKYYYIYNVGDINSDNEIIANAYRYDSYEDWGNYNNPTNVTIKLKSDLFDETDDAWSIPDEYVVTYTRPKISYDEDKKRGHSGSLPLGGLAALSLLLAGRLLRKRG